MDFRCKLLLWGSLCCFLAMPIQAQVLGSSLSAAGDTTQGSFKRPIQQILPVQPTTVAE